MVKSDKTKNSKLNTAQQRNENENAAISDTRCENDYYNCDRGSNGFLGASGDGGTGTTLRGGIQWEEIGRGHGGDSNSDWTSQHNDGDVSRAVFEAIEDVAGASVGGSIGNRNSSDGIDHSGFQGGHGVNRLPEPAERSSGVASLAGSSVERSTSARARTSSEIEASAPAMKRRKVRTREESLLRRNCNNSAGGARNAIVVDELDDRKPAATPSSSKSSVQHSSNRNNNSNDTPRKTSRKSSSSNTICKIRDNNGGSSSNLKRKEFAPSLVEYLRPGGFKKYAPRPEWCHFSTTTALTSDSENQGLNAVGTGVTSANSGEASASGEVIGGSHGNGGLQNGERITGLSTFHYSSPSDSVPMNTYGLPTLPPGFFTNGGLTGLTFSRSPVGGPSDVNVDATVGITNGNNNNNHNLAHLGNVLAISNIDGRNREMIEFFARDLNQSIDAFLTGQRQEQQQLQMQPMMQEQEQQLHQNEQDQQQQVAGVVAAGAGAGGGGGDGDGEGEGQGDNGWNNNGDDGSGNNNRNDNDMDNSNEAVNENDLLDENEDRNAEVAPNANDILAAAAMPQNYDENQPPPQLRGQHDIENLYPILNNLNNISNRTIQQMSIAMMAGMETTSIVPERRDNALVALLNAAGVSEAESEAISAQAIAAAEAEIRAQREERHNRRANNNNNNNNNINNINPEEPTNGNYTSAAELEKLIRAIGTNPNLDTKQKNLTIQGLRDSVWKSNCRLSKRKREEWEDETSTAAMEHTGTQALHSSGDVVNPDRAMVPTGGTVSQPTHHLSFAGARPSASVGTRFKRETPPSCYYRKNKEGDVQLAWKHDPHSTSSNVMEASVPLFSAAELAPTYHDGGINRVLGCPHYARSCKLRHPTSGRLYTCRLCCEQDREMATKDKDSPLDRYEVKEILCMICGALQPAGKHCVNPECASEGKPFARYSCGICNFYDNSPDKAIYHCPFCNVCRSGRGLGIDYRHCMRCNACVSLTDEHHCIPQRLQANCPICHETMFQSTEPLRGLQCGHVMHLNCFTMYMRGGNYTCPLCKKSAEDMTEYFALLDSAIRMQPMPPAYTATTSNIYCQDCGKMGNVSYHFVGLKCQHCGSFNTRELQRVDPNIMASLWQGY